MKNLYKLYYGRNSWVLTILCPTCQKLDFDKGVKVEKLCKKCKNNFLRRVGLGW